MAAKDDAATIRKGYQAFVEGDIPTLTEIIAADAIWHVGGRNRLSGEKRGREAIFGYFGELGTAGITVELHDVVANDQHVVGIHRAVGTREGRKLDERVALVVHMQNGTIREAWEQGDDTRALDEYIA